MNDLLLAQAFASVLNANTDFLALVPSIHAAFLGETAQVPGLVIGGEYENFGRCRKGLLKFELRSNMADEHPVPASEEPPTTHHDRFTALWALLFGDDETDAATAKAALKTAINAIGTVTLLDYGPTRDCVAADSDADDLRTTITLAVAFSFPAAV